MNFEECTHYANTSSEEDSYSSSSSDYYFMKAEMVNQNKMEEKLKNKHISKMARIESLGKTQKQFDKEYSTILSFWIRKQFPNFRYIPKAIEQFIFKFLRLSPEGIWTVHGSVDVHGPSYEYSYQMTFARSYISQKESIDPPLPKEQRVFCVPFVKKSARLPKIK